MAKRRQTGKIVDIRGRLGAASVVDELAQLFDRGEGDLDDAGEVLWEGMKSFGEEEIVEELCRRLTRLEPGEDSTFIAWALEEIGDDRVAERLRDILQTPQLAHRARTEAAMLLNALGEGVDPEALPPAGPEDLPMMLAEVEGQIEQMEESDRAFMLNDLFDQAGRFIGRQNHSDMLRVVVEALGAQEKPVAADMIWALREFGPEEAVREMASRALEQMRQRGLEPSPGMVRDTYGGAFDRACVSDMAPAASQTQVFIAWKQPSERLLMLSFLIDHAYWGGAVKDFFARPGLEEWAITEALEEAAEHGIPMVEVRAERAREIVAEALRANGEKRRPLPSAYRRFHRLVEMTLFGGACPVELLSLEDEARSPLTGRAGQVEALLQSRMPEAGYDAEQVCNGRMLWRDFYGSQAPNIRKPGVWAAAVDYAIGRLEYLPGQTQQVVAARYGVSSGSVSKRHVEIWEQFLGPEQGPAAYTTDRGMPNVLEGIDALFEEEWEDEDLFDDEEWEDDLESDYQDYSDEHRMRGSGIRMLSREEFERLGDELDALWELDEVDALNSAQRRRMREIERLLLTD